MRNNGNDNVQGKINRVSVRLVPEAPLYSRHPIHSPEDAVAAVGDMLRDMDREMLCVVNLKTNGIPINCSIVSVGSLNAALVHPREIMKTTMLSNAASIILVHNHPSGSPQPSIEDLELTRRMVDISELMKIPLLDHVIIGSREEGNYSMLQEGNIGALQERFQKEWDNGLFTGLRESGMGEKRGKQKERYRHPKRML